MTCKKVMDVLMESILEGGLADNLTAHDIAEHHDIDESEIQHQLELGIDVEMEHTADKSVAEEIALDHLFEIPDYYDRLDLMEHMAER